MKYMGSKSRIAKYIVPIIQEHINTYTQEHDKEPVYIEPFVGGANVIDKVKCKERQGYDVNPYLIDLLRHVRDGGELLPCVSKEEYDVARKYYYAHPYSEEDVDNWEIGNIGFLASYNGRFYEAGYVSTIKEGDKIRDMYDEAKRNLEKQAPHLKGIEFCAVDYRLLDPHEAVVYVDPPYENTKQYNYSKYFDYEEFWNIMRKWSKDNVVIISEMQAPEDFECIWSAEVLRSIKSTDKTHAVEKLFMLKEK